MTRRDISRPKLESGFKLRNRLQGCSAERDADNAASCDIVATVTFVSWK
jgi:hypothetical protein